MDEIGLKTVTGFGVGGVAAYCMVWFTRYLITDLGPKLIAAINGLTAAVNKLGADIAEKIDETHGKAEGLHRETRHAMADLAHAVGLKQFEEQLRKGTLEPGPRAG